jgi:Cu/Ag efflux protein CusF
MKTLSPLIARAAVTLSVAIMCLACASQAKADEATMLSADQRHDKTFEGTVTAVDPDARTMSVRRFLFNKTFHAAEPCQVSLADKPAASLKDLHPGHKVEVQYQDAEGVLVADKILQHYDALNGYITAIDPGERTLVIKGQAGTRDFVAAEDCSVLLHEDKIGTLENLKIGHAVTVAYEPTAGSWIVHKIEQKAEAFTGTIQAIDATADTVTARSFMSELKFNLADDCRIVVAGKPDGSLRDLRIGDRVEFSYQNANGVLVANRIGREAISSEEENSTTTGLTAK